MTPALWFYDNGIGVFPIKTRGKEPACASWDDYRCTRDQASRLQNYGVPLGRLGVADSDTPETEVWNARYLVETPFKVQTARGRHRYYRLRGPLPKYIHRDGHTIEFRNRGQYVIGPNSIHPTGVIYTASDWSWHWEDIPYFPADFIFDDRPPAARGSSDGAPYRLPPVIFVGERHDQMFKLMRSLQARGVPLAGVLAACHLENLAKCRPPIDREELDRYLRRVFCQPDQAGFTRMPQSAWDICSGLIEVGLSNEAVLVACRSVEPGFDPMQPAPPLEPDTPTVDWDLDSPGREL